MENLQIVPVPKGVQPQYVEMRVPLYSYGCEKKITKALTHLKGIYSVDVDHGLQKVTVWGICNRDTVLATIKKKRREARFWDQVEADTTVVAAAPTMEETLQEGNASEQQASPHEAPASSALQRGFKMRRSWKRLLPALALVRISGSTTRWRTPLSSFVHSIVT